MEYRVVNRVLKKKMKRIDKGPLGGPDKKIYKNSVSGHKRAWRNIYAAN